MWRRAVRAEKQARKQSEASDPAREVAAAIIESSKPDEIAVGRNIAVAAKEGTATLPEIGNDHNIGLVISCAGFEPCLPLAHVIGGSEVCVSVTAPDFQSTEFMEQKKVDHSGHSIGAVHGRGALLQDVDVINHWERNKVNVHTAAGSGGAQRTSADTFAIDQDQRLFGQQAAQVELDSTVTAIANVQVDGATRLLR